MDKKNVPQNTITRDIKYLAAPTGNIYESVVILYKRANQIALAEKKELNKKLEDFKNDRDSMDEVFENREQIEISKFYERQPKPVLIAISEFENNELTYRRAGQENENTEIELQTFNTGRIPLETKEVFQRNKGIYQIDKVQDEIERHTEHGCEPKDEKDFDGDENTGTHEHIDIDQYVDEILNYENKDGEEKIKDVFTAKEVKDKLLRELHENGDRFTVEQIVKNVEKEMNLDAENLDRTRE